MDCLVPILRPGIAAALWALTVLVLRVFVPLQRRPQLWTAAALGLAVLPFCLVLPPPLTLLWAGGGVVLGGAAAWSHRRFLRTLTPSVPSESGVWTADALSLPWVCGPLHPRICLPASLDGPERDYALLHEKVHVQRKDPFLRLVAFLILCLHWYNPVLWLAYQQFCRDLEAACDETAINTLTRRQQQEYHTAQYRLFQPGAHRPALALGFARKEEKRRFKHVLDYKYPRMLVILMAVCAIAIVLLLLGTDSKRDSTQLEGVAITDCYILDGSLPVDLSEDLRDELVSLLQHHRHGPYTALDTFTPLAGTVLCSDRNGGTTFALVPSPGGTFSLVRTNHDGYTTARKLAPEQGLNTSEDYLAWAERLEHYLSQGRAEALYRLKTPTMGDAPACSAVLSGLNLHRVIGPYTIQLDQDSVPKNITLHIKNCPAQVSERLWQTEYLKDTAALILSLIGDAEQITVVYDTMMFDNAVTYTPQPAEDAAAFQNLYTSYRSKRSQADFPSQDLVPTKVLYAAPQMLPESAPTDSENLLALFRDSRFSLSPNRFSVLMAQPRSNRPPKETVYLRPRYTKSDCPDTLSLPNGTVLDLSRWEHKSVINLYHESFRNSFYRIYKLEDTVWISQWYFDDQDWTLLYLFQTKVLSH